MFSLAVTYLFIMIEHIGEENYQNVATRLRLNYEYFWGQNQIMDQFPEIVTSVVEDTFKIYARNCNE